MLLPLRVAIASSYCNLKGGFGDFLESTLSFSTFMETRQKPQFGHNPILQVKGVLKRSLANSPRELADSLTQQQTSRNCAG